jgi:hypothetical protein
MGLQCKPIGKMRGIHTKLETKKVKEQRNERLSNKKSKKN